jgi:dephospho-CoA kinase
VVVLVDAPESIRRARLLGSRDLPPQDIDRLIGAQLPSAAKRGRSDYVIENSGSPAALEAAAAETWQALLARA